MNLLISGREVKALFVLGLEDNLGSKRMIWCKNPGQRTKWFFGGGVRAQSFSIKSEGVKSRCVVPSAKRVFSCNFTFPS